MQINLSATVTALALASPVLRKRLSLWGYHLWLCIVEDNLEDPRDRGEQ